MKGGTALAAGGAKLVSNGAGNVAGMFNAELGGKIKSAGALVSGGIQAAGDKAAKFGGDLIHGAITGDAIENPNAAQMAGMIGVSFIPGLGQIAAARDAISGVVSGDAVRAVSSLSGVIPGGKVMKHAGRMAGAIASKAPKLAKGAKVIASGGRAAKKLASSGAKTVKNLAAGGKNAVKNLAASGKNAVKNLAVSGKKTVKNFADKGYKKIGDFADSLNMGPKMAVAGNGSMVNMKQVKEFTSAPATMYKPGKAPKVKNAPNAGVTKKSTGGGVGKGPEVKPVKKSAKGTSGGNVTKKQKSPLTSEQQIKYDAARKNGVPAHEAYRKAAGKSPLNKAIKKKDLVSKAPEAKSARQFKKGKVKEPIQINGTPTKKNTPYKPLEPDYKRELKNKIKNRTATKQDYKHFEWDKRFENRRQRGVDRFWSSEKKRLKSGKSGTRKWDGNQRKDILNNKTPQHNGQAIEGHHTYNALDYPHLADNGNYIYPATKNEHLYRWHGGSWQNDTSGLPNDLKFMEEF